MQKTWCDNCGKEIREKPDEVNKNNPDWKPDVHVQLTLRIIGKGEYPIMMDLCSRCGRKYMRHLSQPLDDE